MGRDTIQLETAVSTISSEYLLEFTSEYGIAEELHPELPSPGDRIVDFSEGKKWICNLINALNPTKVKTGTRPRAAHEVPLLIATATRVIAMEDATGLSSSSGTPSTVEKSPLDFSNKDSPRRITKSDETENQGQETVSPEVPLQENVTTVGVTPKIGLEKEVSAMGPLKYHAAFRPTQSTIRERSTRLDTGSTLSAPTLQETPADVSDPDPLSFAKPQSIPEWEIAQSSKRATVAGDPDSEKSTSFTSFTGSPSGIYQPRWGVINSCHLESPDVCQDVVDHIVPPGYFLELRHLRNKDFLNQYNMNLARQVAMGSQLRLRFEQEVRLLNRATEKVAKRDQRIQVREEEIKKLDQEIHSLKSVDTEVQGLRNQTKNLEALLEAEVDMKKVANAKNVELAEELESLRAKFSDLQVNNTQLSQQVAISTHVDGDRGLSLAYWARPTPFAVLKCAESPEIRQAFADVVSAGLAKGISEGLQYGIEHGKVGRDLGDVEAYDPEANDKFVKALQDLKNLKYPIVDQLERLKDSPIDLIMASLHLESDTEEDSPQWIRDLCPSSSQLKIPIYPEVPLGRERRDIVGGCHWREYKPGGEEKEMQSVPTAAPQGLAILLMDAATRTEGSEAEVSPRLIRSKSLPHMFNSEWP
ncbi:hypothetical protein Tco_0543620 [Tanacetum coccineum]